MLDPLTALGLAASVVQFVDFTAKVIKQADEFAHETRTVGVLELQNVTKDLLNLTEAFRQRARAQVKRTPDEKALDDLFEKCNALAEVLVQCIAKVTTKIHKNAKLGPWKNVRAALMTVWKADKFEAISKQLDLYRQELILRILVVLEARNASQAAHLDNRFDRLERSNQQVIEVVAINQTKTRDAKEFLASDLVSTQDDEGVAPQQRQAKTIAAILTFKDGATRILSTDPPEDDRHLNKSNFQTALTLRREVKESLHNDCVGTAGIANLVTFASGAQKILNSLFFRHMDHRYEEVAAAHQETFHWIFDDETSDVPWDNFVHWLKCGSGCYWIDGKAGSGKSTLMKYLSSHPRTRTSLQAWAGERELVVSSFYFWNIGSPLQKSQSGLLRALLFSLLEPRPQLIPLAFPGLCRAALTEKADLSEPTLVELKQAINLLVQQTKNTMRLCFVIDGIDEYDGDHAEMSTFVKSLAACDNVKMIVSSRPIPACVEVFSPLPHLRLQDLTYNDIQVYVQDTLRSHPNMKKLESRNHTQVQDLVAQITKKASGVFLWVFLVVKSLLEGLRNHDRIEDLETRLRELPADLENLYQHMLDGMRPSYRNQAERMLQIVLRSLDIQRETHTLTALQFSFAEEYDYQEVVSAPIAPISDMQRRDRREEVEGRIRSRCCGLLELHGRPHRKLAATDTAEPTIGFLHKTVVEFLRQPHFHNYYGEQLMQGCIDISLSSSCLMMVKTVEMGRSTLSNHHFLLQYAEYCLSYLTSLPEAHITTEVALFRALDAAMTVQLNASPSGRITHSSQLAQAPQHWSLQMINFLSQPLASGYSSGTQQQRTGIVVLTAFYGKPDLARNIFQSTKFGRGDLGNLLGQLMLSLFEGTFAHRNLSHDILHEASRRRRQHIAEIFKMALLQGADPNEKCAFEGDRSYWNGLNELPATDLETDLHRRQLNLFEKSTQLCSAWELLLAFMAGLRPTFLDTCCSWPCAAGIDDRLLILDLVETLLDSGVDRNVAVSSRVEVGTEEETDEANHTEETDEANNTEETDEANNAEETDKANDEKETDAANDEACPENKGLIIYRRSALGVLKQAMRNFLQPPPGSKGSVPDSIHTSSRRILAKMVEQGAVDEEWHNNVLVVRSPQYAADPQPTARSDQSLPETAKTLTHKTTKTVTPLLVTLEEHYVSNHIRTTTEKDTYDSFPQPAIHKAQDLGEQRLKDMDAGNVNFQIVSHGPLNASPGACRQTNDEHAAACKKNSARFGGFSMLPMAEPAAAADELARCVKDHGFVGALINNHLNGEFYDSSKLGPVFARVVELDVRIYIHPTFATDEWMPRYKGNYSDEAAQSLSMYGWGWHSETGLHVLRLWASGLLDDHPSLKLIIGHVGEMLPFQLDRIFPMSTRWASNTRDLKTVWNENIWITTSGMFSSAPMSCLLKMCKIDGILYSVDHPFSANEKGLRFVEKLKKSGMLSHEDLTAICSSNAERSLRLNS